MEEVNYATEKTMSIFNLYIEPYKQAFLPWFYIFIRLPQDSGTIPMNREAMFGGTKFRFVALPFEERLRL